MDNQIEKLENDLNVLKNRFAYEINKLEKQNKGLKEQIILDLKKGLLIEIDGLKELSTRLQNNDSKILDMYIQNMEQNLNIF